MDLLLKREGQTRGIDSLQQLRSGLAEPVPWPSIALGALLLASLAVLGGGYAQNRKLQHANQALRQTRLQLAEETESERRRIARDLHDQTLADLRRLLLTAPPSPAYRESVEAISTEIRRICEDLSPSVLENVGLTAALEWALGEALRQMPAERSCRSRFVCGDDVEERLGLDAAARIQVYRIVQEALANAVRHAEPKELLLGVELAGDGTLSVSVEDDGGGFAAERAPLGRGLANIRSRASLIGARVSWSERGAGGTSFRVEVPATAPSPGEQDSVRP